MEERLKAAFRSGNISMDELRAGLEYHLREESLNQCKQCGLNGEHSSARNKLKADNKSWSELHRAFKNEIFAHNVEMRKFGIERQELCYWGSILDADFEKASVYNRLAGEYTSKMLNGLRYASPFILLNVPAVANLSFGERKVAAACSLIAKREEMAQDEERRFNQYSAEVREMLRQESKDGDEVIRLVTGIVMTETVDVEEVNKKLPAELKLDPESFTAAKATFASAQRAVESVPEGQRNTTKGLAKILRSAQLESEGDAAKEHATERARKRERWLRSAWAIRDKSGKLWRRIRGDQTGRFERLSLRHSLTRDASGAPFVVTKVVRTHPAPPGFVPELEE